MATVIDEIALPGNPDIALSPLAPGLDPDWSLADLQEHLGGILPHRIRLYPSPGTATEQNFLDVLARKTCQPELIDGVIVEKPVGYFESRLAFILGYLIQQFVFPRKLGVVFGADCPIRLGPDQIRMPDVSFFSWSRFADGKFPLEQVLGIAPDLAVEVISPSNTKAEMDRKLTEYFTASTRLVWYVYPEVQAVRVFQSPSVFQDLTGDEVLEGADVLPGFAVSVRTVFELANQ
ncbi:MAG: hypothetical protein JWM11_3160 [Planctomycetaceae bacterium]|nr:hypothetical protein [Planctomycetaceae bacterium]